MKPLHLESNAGFAKHLVPPFRIAALLTKESTRARIEAQMATDIDSLAGTCAVTAQMLADTAEHLFAYVMVMRSGAYHLVNTILVNAEEAEEEAAQTAEKREIESQIESTIDTLTALDRSLAETGARIAASATAEDHSPSG